jgi:DNA-directed RNA polymerase subunit omega
MARIVTSDCQQNIENEYKLVLVAAKRAKTMIEGGSNPTVDISRDKFTVVALREIAAGNVTEEIVY